LAFSALYAASSALHSFVLDTNSADLTFNLSFYSSKIFSEVAIYVVNVAIESSSLLISASDVLISLSSAFLAAL
jgi:hypothetical protein